MRSEMGLRSRRLDGLMKKLLIAFLVTFQAFAGIVINPGGGSGLPDQTGNSGKYLTTNGSVASWATISAIAGSTGSTDRAVIVADGTGGSTVEASSVVINASNQIVPINGTAGTPGITAGDQASTGFYKNGTNSLGIAANGARSMAIGDQTQIFYTNSGATTLTLTGDANTFTGTTSTSAMTFAGGSTSYTRLNVQQTSTSGNWGVYVFGSAQGTRAGNWAIRDEVQGDFIFEASDSNRRVITTSGPSGTLEGIVTTKNIDTTAVGNVGSGEDDLITYAVPANTLGINGDYLEWEAAGTFAATTDDKRVKCFFGATPLFDTGMLTAANGGDWMMSGKIIRTGAATQKAGTFANTQNAEMAAAATYQADYTTPGETLSGAVTLKCTGENGTDTSDDAVVQQYLTVKWVPKNGAF